MSYHLFFNKDQTIELPWLAPKELFDEDWRTAIAQKKGPIPKGSKIIITGFIENLYGSYLTVTYHDQNYYIDPVDLDIEKIGYINESE